MKTIKQIADETGKSKTAVRKSIEKLQLFDKLQTDGRQFLIDEAQETLILNTFKKTEPQTENRKPVSDNAESLRLVSDVVTTLTKQLEAKDRQIEFLEQSNRELTAALENTTASLKAAQALHAGTMGKQLTGKKGFFSRFRKGEGDA